MYRRGHVGIVLLALAPILYVLLRAGRPLLAVLACNVLLIEPLPDCDLRTSLLTHRGISHSLVTAVAVGIVCAGLGWAAGTYVTVPLANIAVSAGGTTSDISFFIWGTNRLTNLDVVTLTVTGFVVGAGGICLHLLGDIITISGIQPFLPISERTISLSGVRAKNRLVNAGLFLLGFAGVGLAVISATPL